MKRILVSTFSLLLMFPLQAREEDERPISFNVDVPNPGWKLEITGLYRKGDSLLVVGKASHDGSPSASVISKAGSIVMTDAKSAGLPGKYYLLGRKWNWGEGYQAINEAELKALIKDAEPVNFTLRHARPKSKDFIGLELAAAQKLADKHSLKHRVIMVDGEPRPTTRDHRPERLNFTVVDGKVTEVSKG
ncbi:MAG: hypothetical protein AAGI48_14480 [Verrucomicrobiota bacterium]